MKKLGKALILILLLCGVGVGGFFIGNRMPEVGVAAAETDAEELRREKMIQKIDELSTVIEQDFLFTADKKKMEDGVYKGLFESLKDPYSVYYSPEEFQRMMEDSAGQFAGVGVVITGAEDDFITVVSPIAGTPGERAGLKAGDKIVAIDGQSYMATDLEEAVAHMRGEVGTEVVLSVRRKENQETKTFDLTLKREMIQVQSVSSQMLQKEIGYVQITSFDEPTAADFKTHVEKLQAEGAKALVIDLRNNPGGLLSSCEEIADYLLGDATIVTTVDNKGAEQVSKSDAKSNSIPVVLLVNEGSASASEILTGALRDNKRAIAVGTKTYGKGIVQRIYPLAEGEETAGYKLTVAEYQTPSGEKINKVGITPDIVVELPAETKSIGPAALDADVQLKRAIEEVQKTAGITPAEESESSASQTSETTETSSEAAPSDASSEGE